METLLRAALLTWLRGDTGLVGLVNTIEEEAPSRASPPWLAIAASARAARRGRCRRRRSRRCGGRGGG